jgi:hypothetical protein
VIRLLALAVTLPPVLAVEVGRAYVDALRRNSGGSRVRLVAMPTDDGGVELLPVCSCCRMRALRPAGSGRVCPDCDSPDRRHAHVEESRPPTEGTNGGV